MPFSIIVCAAVERSRVALVSVRPVISRMGNRMLYETLFAINTPHALR